MDGTALVSEWLNSKARKGIQFTTSAIEIVRRERGTVVEMTGDTTLKNETSVQAHDRRFETPTSIITRKCFV